MQFCAPKIEDFHNRKGIVTQTDELPRKLYFYLEYFYKWQLQYDMIFIYFFKMHYLKKEILDLFLIKFIIYSKYK